MVYAHRRLLYQVKPREVYLQDRDFVILMPT
jgi:hypothetical protein